MKTADLVVGNVYAMRENSYGVIKPIVVLDTRRVERVSGYSNGVKLYCPASKGASSSYSTTKGLLALKVDMRLVDLVDWVQLGKDPKEHSAVKEGLAKLDPFLDTIKPPRAVEFRLEFGRGEWPSGLSVVRPQVIIGDYAQTIMDEARKSGEQERKRKAEQKKAQEILEELQKAYVSIKASLTDFGGEEVPLTGWHQANGNEVRMPISDLTIIAESLATALDKIKENR